MERSLQGAAIFEEVKDRLHKSALGLSGGQQQSCLLYTSICIILIVFGAVFYVRKKSGSEEE